MLQVILMYVGLLIQLNVVDNVLIVCEGLLFGVNLLINGMMVCLCVQVLVGYKIVVWWILQGEVICKYDMIIGWVVCDIEVGEYVYMYNVELIDYVCDFGFGLDVCLVDYILEVQCVMFNGIVWFDGCVVMCNFIGILVLVNCLFIVIKNIVVWFMLECFVLFFNVDGVVVFVQMSGCGMFLLLEYFDVLCCMLVGYVWYLNLVGVLIVGLGCECNQVVDLMMS